MMPRLPFAACTAIGLCLSPLASYALTPEEVWQAWQDQITQAGGEISVGSATRQGDTLEVKGFTAQSTAPELHFESQIDTILLKDIGNASVEVVIPKPFQFELKKPEEAAPFAKFEVDQTQGKTIASGDVGAINFDFDYPQITAKLLELSDKGESFEDLNGQIALKDIKGKYVYSGTSPESLPYDYAYEFADLSVTMRGKRPSNGDAFDITAQLAGAAATAKGVLLAPEIMQDLPLAISSGFTVDGTTTTGPFTANVNLTEASGNTKIALKLDSSKGLFAVNKERLDYGFDLTGAELSVAADASGMPEMDGSLGALNFAVSAPTRQDKVAEDFSFVTKLIDLQVSEGVWSMFDPGAELVRDPASFVIDLTGKGAWVPEAIAPQGGMVDINTPPVFVESINLKQLLLRIIGGEIDGSGALTFNHEDVQTWGGFPAPDGKITFNLSGINALIDKAVAMGFVAEDDLMSLRMGLAMFTRPGSKPDSLVSEIEFKDNGLFVNGQRLQ